MNWDKNDVLRYEHEHFFRKSDDCAARTLASSVCTSSDTCSSSMPVIYSSCPLTQIPKIPLVTPMHRWEDNVKMDLKLNGW
jgi:hypothetical protein